MAEIVTDERVARFVSEKLGLALCPPYTCMGTERDGQIINGVLFNNYEGANVNFSAAGTRWTRGFLQAVDDYVFHQLGCLRMTAITEQPAVVALAEKLGGEIEGKLRHHFGHNRHGWIVGILAEDYRY